MSWTRYTAPGGTGTVGCGSRSIWKTEGAGESNEWPHQWTHCNFRNHKVNNSNRTVVVKANAAKVWILATHEKQAKSQEMWINGLGEDLKQGTIVSFTSFKVDKGTYGIDVCSAAHKTGDLEWDITWYMECCSERGTLLQDRNPNHWISRQGALYLVCRIYKRTGWSIEWFCLLLLFSMWLQSNVLYINVTDGFQRRFLSSIIFSWMERRW